MDLILWDGHGFDLSRFSDTAKPELLELYNSANDDDEKGKQWFDLLKKANSGLIY
jgi:hypothetical protein